MVANHQNPVFNRLPSREKYEKRAKPSQSRARSAKIRVSLGLFSITMKKFEKYCSKSKPFDKTVHSNQLEKKRISIGSGKKVGQSRAL